MPRDREFAVNATLNLMERWVAPYDAGIARYRLTDFAGAVDSFQDALATVPTEHACEVRINLALSQESVGDAAMAGGEAATAGDAWRAGVATLARGGCLDATTQHGR